LLVPFRGPSIAVLPFDNEGGDEDLAGFSDGLGDEIITALSRYPDLAVIGRTQTRKYRGSAIDVRQLSRELGGVHYVVGGSLRPMAAGIRVNAWLSDHRGTELWSESYQEDLTADDLFRIQDDLTLKVVNALAAGHGELSRAELARAARKPPEHLASYLCVLRAYQYWHAHTPENHREARDCLEAAVQRDPEYPDAWALLAYIYAEEYHHRCNERAEQYHALDKALDTVRRALRLDSTSQVAHGVMALIHSFMGDKDSFVIEAKRAIDLNPGNADWLAAIGTSYAQLGLYEEGVSLVRQAIALNPRPMPWLYMTFFLQHYHHGRYDRALQEALRTETEDYRTPLFRAAAYGQLGELQKARDQLAAMRADLSTDSLDVVRGLLIQRNGYSGELADHLLDGLRRAGLD
jgi:adenylate cyclase